MQTLLKCLLAVALVVGFSLVARAEKAPSTTGDNPGVKIGDKVGDFTFKDIRYLPRQLADFGERKAYVIVFTTLDCPVVQRYLPRAGRARRGVSRQGRAISDRQRRSQR